MSVWLLWLRLLFLFGFLSLVSGLLCIFLSILAQAHFNKTLIFCVQQPLPASSPGADLFAVFQLRCIVRIREAYSRRM